jgi:uncharacterized protein (TIGR02145 family)
MAAGGEAVILRERMYFVSSALAALLTLNMAPLPCSPLPANDARRLSGQQTLRASGIPVDSLVIEGHAYPVIRFGAQTWLGENLSATRDGNGNTLAWVSPGEATARAGSRGRLYPWESASRAAPAGWRVPTVKDWQALLSFFGGEAKAGRKLLAGGPGEFGAPLSGGVDVLGRSLGQGEQALFWTSAEASVDLAFCLAIGQDGEAQLEVEPKASCFAVRFIRKDSPQLAAPAPSAKGRPN